MLGDLIVATFQFGYEHSRSVLERAEELGRRAVALDPNCQPAHATMAFVHFLKGRRRMFLAEAEKTIQLNPNNAHYMAAISLHLAMAGEWERGVELMDKACRLNPHHPGWHHLVPFMNYYRQGEYDLALIEAQAFNTPEYFWDPLIRAAVLGQLDRRIEGRKAVDGLLAMVPDFKPRAQSLIRRFAYSDENIDMLLEGLQKAGLELQSEV
jgi:tetratricopeptide (TPR) repeat protein